MNKYPNVTRQLKDGSGIYINPANKGKFTASANAAGMGVQEFASHVLANKDDYSSTQVKRANFARNAARWNHAYGGHIMAAGGWPPGLKLKQPLLYFAPYFSNTLTGLVTPSAEVGMQSKIGKQKGPLGWNIEPHIGYAYNTPENKFPLSGGLDAKYVGLRSKNDKGLANVDLGVGYHPAQGLGVGVGAGYKYRVLGQSDTTKGELKPGNASLDLMPYGGWQVMGRRQKDQEMLVEGAGTSEVKEGANKYTTGLVYGLKGEAQWRPKLFKNASGTSAPITFFGRGDLNFNPIRGQEEQSITYSPSDYYPDQDSGLNLKPSFSGTIGARMPLSRVKSYLPDLKRAIPAVEGGEYYEEPTNPGDFTYSTRGVETDNKSNPILGDYSEEIQDFKNRSKEWGGGKFNPNFMTDWQTRMDLQNAAVDEDGNELWTPNQIDYNQSLIENEDEGYKYGGTMKFKYGGFNNSGFNALPKDVQAKIKARTFANGGTMPQLTEFNEGGRHEENVLGGIPQGSAPDGRLNLVEEGETKLNAANYIFSDSLKLDEGIAAAFNLPKAFVGKTFAEISKKLDRPNSRRDNDTIEQNAKQRDLDNLMQAQEAFKQVDLEKDLEMMKTKHPELMGAMEAAMQQQQQRQPAPEAGMSQGQGGQPMSPEEEQMMMQQQMAQQQGGMPQEQMAQIPMSYGGSMFACGGKMYRRGSKMYPNGGALNNMMPNGVTGDNPKYAPFDNYADWYHYNINTDGVAPSLIDNPNFRPVMSPMGLRDEPMFGSQEEATSYMQNPANGIAVSQWRNPDTGMGGQVQSNQYLNMNNLSDAGGGNVEIMGQGWAPGTTGRQQRNALQVAGTPQFSFMSGNNNMVGYRRGGVMYGNGGQVWRSIGAGAYGVGEGLVDTLLPFMDPITDKGYEALANMGHRDPKDLERDAMIRGFSNTAGAIGGAVLNPASLGSAISQGSKGLGAGVSNIYGTNDKFDQTVNTLAKIGSVAGSFVGGGNPAGGAEGTMGTAEGAVQGASKFPQFAETIMKANQNPFLQQVTGMAGSMIQRNGGHMYPTFYPRYKNNAGPMGQEMTGLFNYGGSLQAPRQQMYMPLDNVERMGGRLFEPGGPLDGIDPNMIKQNVDLITSGQAYLQSPEAAIAMGYDPKVVAEWTDPNTGEYEVPPAYRMEGALGNFTSGITGNSNMLAGALNSGANAFRAPIETLPYLKPGQISPRIMGDLVGLPGEDNIDPSILANSYSTQTNLLNEGANTGLENNSTSLSNTGEDIKLNFSIIDPVTGEPKVKSYTREEALEAPELIRLMDPEDIAQYFDEAEGKVSTSTNSSEDITDEEETDLEREIRLAEEELKNAKTDEEKKKAQEYLSALKRANMGLEDRNVNLSMKQTPLQALGMAAPAAYNIGMGLFGKTAKYNLDDYLNKSKITPYEMNVDPQLAQTKLAYNAAQEAVRNAAPGSGAYLTNLSNIANRRSDAFKSILAGKENADNQLRMQADIYNANIKGQNAETALKVQDLNYRAKAAKQAMLAKGLEQVGQIAENSTMMDAQEKYMRLLSPQYGKTFEYKTIFEQALEALKNRRENKQNEESV